MAVGFDGVLFTVSVDDSGRLPRPERGTERIRTWQASIFIAGDANLDALEAKVVDVTARPAIGNPNLGTLIIEGPGDFGDLTIPTNAGGVEVWRAALQVIDVQASLTSNLYKADATFILGDRVS